MKRCLTKLVAFLLLGAIVNVAVAWGCTLPRQSQSHPYERPMKTNIPRYIDDPVIWYCHVERRFGAVVVKSWPMWIHDGSGARLIIHDTEQDSVGSLTVVSDNERLIHDYGGNYPYTDASDADSRLVPAWSFPRRVRVDADALGEAEVVIDQAWGWPLAAVRRGSHLKDWRMAWILGLSRIDQDNYVNEILLQRSDHIIWAGFVINTMFYAAIIWSLAFGPFAARRFVRNKRGHCIKCGYDLGHADHRACPECGAAA